MGTLSDRIAGLWNAKWQRAWQEDAISQRTTLPLSHYFNVLGLLSLVILTPRLNHRRVKDSVPLARKIKRNGY